MPSTARGLCESTADSIEEVGSFPTVGVEMADSDLSILLSEILLIDNPKEYKVHFGTWNGTHHPLDLWVKNSANWLAWQEWRGKRARWTRRYIFSLMQMHHEGVGRYLFGGIFEVLGTDENHHEVRMADTGEQFIGRLKIDSPYRQRKSDVMLEKHYGPASSYPMTVAEILPTRYTGRSFPGYQTIHISFAELEGLIGNSRMDWKSPLASVKGVYLITDRSTNERYVGSAYGDAGIWSRWESYVHSGHGGNKGLRDVLGRQEGDPIDYCRRHFQFALLEYVPADTPDDAILARENWWKQVLLSRTFGLNRN